MKNPRIFWNSVDTSGDCWLWTGPLDGDGYGMAPVYWGTYKAHKQTYIAVNGEVPEGLSVDHTCWVRHCVKPSHLRAVTHKQNHENRKGAQANSKSGIRGVSWHKASRKWRGQVKHNGQIHHVGTFVELFDAEEAVIKKRMELYTHNNADRMLV